MGPRAKMKRAALQAIILGLTASLILQVSLSNTIPVQAATGTSFYFAAAGDIGSVTSGNGLATLNNLSASGTSFLLALGDLSYSRALTGDEWCSEFKSRYNNIEIIDGNHDTGEQPVNDTSATRSYEKFVANCPFVSPSPDGATFGPGTCTVSPSCYGREYYFDYPSANPLARFILISPSVLNITGACGTECNLVSGSLCNPQNQASKDCWPYAKNDPHYVWTANAIDNARQAGTKWVIVGMHKPCISAGEENCIVGSDLFNLLVSKKVDLVLEGHDHSYQRSKQLALNPSSCPIFPVNVNTFVDYNSGCVVDDGSHGNYAAGAGTTVMIVGTGGSGYFSVNDPTVHPQNAAEAPYFVSLMGSNTPGNGHGFAQYTVSTDSIQVQTYFSGSFSDSFSITQTPPPPPLSTSFTYSPSEPTSGQTVSFTGTATGGTPPYNFSWNFGDSASATGGSATHVYRAAGSYSVILTVKDSSMRTGHSYQTITVIAPLTSSFTYAPTNPGPLTVITFSGAGQGGFAPYGFRWDFGDGSTGTGASVSHSYLLPGSYAVTLTVTDARGQTARSSKVVNVNLPLPGI